MAESRVSRKLAAILSADVAGYTRLMGVDEVGTLVQLKDHRKKVIDPSVGKHGGRIVGTAGDGFLIEFSSAVDAVDCAVVMQRDIAKRNEGTAEDRRMEFRIGIKTHPQPVLHGPLALLEHDMDQGGQQHQNTEGGNNG